MYSEPRLAGSTVSWFYTSSLQRHRPLEEWLVTARERVRNVIAGCGFPAPGYLLSCSIGIHTDNIGKALINLAWVLRVSEISRAEVRQYLLPSLQEALIPEMKWRKVCPASRSLSLPDSIPCISRASMESTDSFFPSKKPLGSGEFSVLVHGNCSQRQGFLSSHFCEKRSSQPGGLLRAVSFFLQIHKGKPRAQVASENRGWGVGWGLVFCPRKMLNAVLLQRSPTVRRRSWRRGPRATGSSGSGITGS